jgi:hypothetical protein
MGFIDPCGIVNSSGNLKQKADHVYLGLNTAHTHSRASEFLVVVQGTLLSGFILENGVTTQVNATLPVSFLASSFKALLLRIAAILRDSLSSGLYPLPIQHSVRTSSFRRRLQQRGSRKLADCAKLLRLRS